MNKPDIRFNGFDGEWVEKKLGDCLCKSISNGIMNRPGINELKVKHINVVNMYAEDKIHINDLTYFLATEEDIKKCDVQVGDIFITRSSIKAEGIAQANVLLDKSNLVFDDHLMQLRFSKSFNPEFLKELLRSKSVRRQFILKGKTTTMTTIGQGEISSTDIFFPSPAEQTKIGNLFSQIDSLIASTQKEHDKLVALKKCMLQKMFPKKGCLVPEIRFKGFTGDWVETKFYNIGTVKSGYAFQSENFVNQGIPVIRITNIQDGEVSFDEIVYYSEFDIDKDFIAERGDILLAMSGATTGKTGVYKREQSSYINQRVGKFIFNDENTFKPFYKSLFDTEFFMEQVIGSVATGAQPNIGTKNVENMIFTIPIDKNEQQKIGSYFQNLDNLISKQSAELEKLKNVKKTLLSKMFV